MIIKGVKIYLYVLINVKEDIHTRKGAYIVIKDALRDSEMMDFIVKNQKE